MKISSSVASSVGALVVLAAASFVVAEDEKARQLESLEQRFSESLVQVRYHQRVSRSTAEPPAEQELTTTGVIVSPEGLVMVSAIIYEPFNEVPHGVGIRFPASVSRAEAKIADTRIRLMDGSEYRATHLGRDPEADVAFFRIEAEDREFTPVVFGADTSATVGEEVVVVSLLPEPIGPAVAVELSRVQALTSRPQAGYMVATGAADPVGSLMVSLDGDVIGYVDALTVPVPDTRSRNPLAFLSVMRDLPKGIGRGFARPSREFVDAGVRESEDGPTRRSWLGVEMQAVSNELAAHMELPVSEGILLGYVYRDSPAEIAGLQVGDVLVELDGEPIEVSREEDIGAFAATVLRAGVGADLELGYIRDGATLKTTAHLNPAPRSAREAETVEVDELDLAVREITYDYVATRFLEPEQKGVVVVKPPVAVSSNPNRVAPGDLLVRLDNQLVDDLDSFRAVMDSVRERRPDEVVIFVERGMESFFFALKPDWD
jgi:serine protease Do